MPPIGTFNSHLSPCKASTLTALLGRPREDVGAECRPITNRALKARMVTESVGPFRVTGLDVAVASLRRVLEAVRTADPAVYACVGTAGMLCCRYVRGSKRTLSNHSWGTAIDLTFGGEVDPRGDGLCQAGLLRAYRFFHAEGWYWGAGFPTEDAMHFELAEETARKLLAADR
ncbi:MAG: M15 family metallopeptidase [Fimbriimonadaceae bacterium]|nr:MAG: M15 family metallopeptidase [Fimbriimonadaceae bacterium]